MFTTSRCLVGSSTLMLRSDYFCEVPDFDEYAKCQGRVGEAVLVRLRTLPTVIAPFLAVLVFELFE